MKTSMEGDDVEAMKAAMQTLTTASHKLAEEMYKSTSAEAATAGSPGDDAKTDGGDQPSNGGKEKVVDAEFEEVDKEK